MPYADPEKRRECARSWAQRMRERNPEKYREYQNRWRAAQTPERRRANRFKHRYGITAEQHKAMMDAQDGKCAVCMKPEEKKRGHYLHVDHCHKTGRVRGLLCSACNRAAGFLGDSAARLRRLADYLEGVM